MLVPIATTVSSTTRGVSPSRSASDALPRTNPSAPKYSNAAGRWLKMLSEGMENQHLATAESNDLIHWKPLGTVEIAAQPWFAFRHGAPFVWGEDGFFYMILMGEENGDHRSSLFFILPRWALLGNLSRSQRGLIIFGWWRAPQRHPEIPWNQAREVDGK